MAQRWYSKATVQSSLISVLPASAIAVAAIVIQTLYAERQLKQQNDLDKRQAISDSLKDINDLKKYRSDSLLAERQLQLNTLQFNLENKRRESELLIAKNMASLNKQALAVSKSQYALNKQAESIKRVNNITRFGQAFWAIKSFMLNTQINSEDERTKNYTGWQVLFVERAEELVQNPILIENPPLLSDWRELLDNIRVMQTVGSLMDANKDTPNYIPVEPQQNVRQIMRVQENTFIEKLIRRSEQFYNQLLAQSKY